MTGRRIATGIGRRRWDTRAGEIELQIPKIRQGSYFPSFLEPRRRSEQALLAVVQQAYVCGVSTRRVDQLVESLGLRICQERGQPGLRGAGRARRGVPDAAAGGPLPVPVPGRQDGEGPRRRPGGQQGAGRSRTASTRPAAARSSPSTSARPRPRRSGPSFLRGLVKRGLVGVQLAISDAHAGLKAAIAKVLGCAWQRCTVHFLRDCFGHARKDQHGLLGALIRPIFNADSLDAGARSALRSGRAPRRAPRQDRGDARRRRGRHPRLLRVPAVALAQAALDEPARALQPRDRPPHRRRRHLPRRPLA